MPRWDQGGAPTVIPDWFFQAVETQYASRTVEVDECDVAYQLWGDAGKPGLLFIHGMNAHAHWWDFIAPQFLDGYQVAAMNLCGMGDSDYRYEYHGATFAEEIKAVCDDCGFDNNVTLVAHSFGGNMAVKAANLFPDRFGALILVDSGIRHPDEPLPNIPSMGGGRGKVYPDRETALGRFRVQPPQPCENAYILDYIARNSLMPVDGGGWAWKFDEDLLTSMFDVERTPDDYRSLSVPMGLIYGADSELFSGRSEEHMRELVPQEFPAVAIADAQHHLFLDQPEEFVRVLRDMLVSIPV
jgi:pimeloyl-ACP methyl ester carboxylesterase